MISTVRRTRWIGIFIQPLKILSFLLRSGSDSPDGLVCRYRKQPRNFRILNPKPEGCGGPVRWPLKSTPPTDAFSGFSSLGTLWYNSAGVLGPTAQEGAIIGAIPGRRGADGPKRLLQGRCGGGEGVEKTERKEAKSVVGGTAAVSRGQWG